MGSHLALGAQYELDFKNFNLKAQYIYFDNKPRNASGESRDFVEMTAYGFPYNVTSNANLYSIGLAYTIPINKGPLISLQIYNDYSYMDKVVAGWEDTQMNVLGILWDIQPLYIYTDIGMGKHHPWLGPQYTDALTTGDPLNSWEARFNVNVGYYY